MIYLGVVIFFIGLHSCSNDFEEITTTDETMSRSSNATALNSNLASLFKGGAPTLTDSQIQQVNAAYAKMISINCYNGIDRAVRNKVSYSGTIFIDDSELSAYFYQNSLAFPSHSILPNSMEHEFIHMYQRDVHGKKVDTDKEKRDTGMMEFELAFYQGIIRYLDSGKSWIWGSDAEDGDPCYQSLWISSLDCNSSLRTEIENKFKKYVESICKNGTPTSIDVDDFIEWSEIFGQYCRGYNNCGYLYGNSNPNYGVSCINAMLKLF